MLLGSGAWLIALAGEEHRSLGFLGVTLGNTKEQKVPGAERRSTSRTKGQAEGQNEVRKLGESSRDSLTPGWVRIRSGPYVSPLCRCHSSLGFTPVRKSWPDTTQTPTHTQTHTHTRIHDQQEVRWAKRYNSAPFLDGERTATLCIKDSEISSMQPQHVTNRAFSSCNDLRHTVRALEADGSGGRKEVR